MNPDLKMANDLYNKSQEAHGVSRPLKRSYLEKSLSLYRSQMRQTALKNIPSLQKNFGLASYRLADVLDADDELPLIIYHLSEAIQAFSMAWTMRPEQQRTEWGGRLEELISDCFENAHRSRKCYRSKLKLMFRASSFTSSQWRCDEIPSYRSTFQSHRK